MKDKVTEALEWLDDWEGSGIKNINNHCDRDTRLRWMGAVGAIEIMRKKFPLAALKSGELVVVESIPLAKKYNSEYGWTVDFAHVEAIHERVCKTVPWISKVGIEAVVMVMADLGYVSLRPRQDGECNEA